MRITTLTTAYDTDEDRLRLAVADAAGQRRVLWLTRRLSERLAPALLQGLEAAPLEDEPQQQQPPPAGPATAPAGDEAQQRQVAARAQAAQAYAQLEARLASKPVAPVQVDPDVSQGLVHRIELKAGQAGTRGLEFHGPGFPACELWLTPRELRQWLGQLRSAFKAADWRQDLWPGWLQAL